MDTDCTSVVETSLEQLPGFLESQVLLASRLGCQGRWLSREMVVKMVAKADWLSREMNEVMCGMLLDRDGLDAS